MLEFVHEVVGVDIADSMIEMGKQLHKGKPIEFILNKKDELRCFSDDELEPIEKG